MEGEMRRGNSLQITKRSRIKQMDLLSLVCPLMFLCLLPSVDTSLITGQRVCRVGKGKPCYKLAYFSEPRWRLSFEEAGLACKRDGGELLSVESASEQQIIEQLITELRPSDGDFWIGLRRHHGGQETSEHCPSEYYWMDGSKATFRNWHWDEPSCGYEVCVVMYHQPSAPPSVGGVYMFQWNDDNCETKNNFICKYTTEKPPDPSPSGPPSHTSSETPPTSLFPWSPAEPEEVERGSTSLNWVYIILPTMPLLLLLLAVTGVFCFRLLARRKTPSKQPPEACPSAPPSCPSPAPADVYKVIRSQQEADLEGTRPHTKNTSFLGSSPDTPPGDYDNLGGRGDTESGFVTLASTESGFLNYELNDLSLGRRGNHRDLYDGSLGRRQGGRDSYDGGLGRYGHRDSYDRSLGRSAAAATAEMYGVGCYGDRELYEAGLGGKGGFYDGGGGLGMKAELYQTYLVSGRDDAYQTSLCRYGDGGRQPYEASAVGRYGNEAGLSGGGRRYFRETEWVDSDSY